MIWYIKYFGGIISKCCFCEYNTLIKRTFQDHQGWIKHIKLYVNDYNLGCVLKSSLWTKSDHVKYIFQRETYQIGHVWPEHIMFISRAQDRI